jgi:transcriptional regulator with XRE-family HTH domain
MPRAGRPEQPLVTGGPAAQLAGELRLMRQRDDLTYGQLAEKTGLSAATLRAAAAGARLPTLKVTCAFASACGGDQDTVLALWTAAAGQEPPGQPLADPPDPAAAASAADLVGMLNLLRQWADSPSLAELSRRAGGPGFLPRSTVSDMLRGQRLPRLELMLTFVRACGLEEDRAAAWQAAWEHVRARESDAAAAASRPSVVLVAGPPPSWDPALIPKEAPTLGISKSEYEQAVLFARRAVREHQRLGSARDQWEPTPVVNAKLAGPFIADGEQELASRLEKEADPALDEAQGLIEEVKGSLDDIAGYAVPVSSPESGSNYSVTEAVARVRQDDMKIEQDEADGLHYHRRASLLLQRLASWAPWLEAAGFLTFVTYYLDVPLFEPWQDWLGWSFAVAVAVVIILGQTWLVRQAAKSHNQAREIYANGLQHAAKLGFTRRNWYLAGTAVTAAAVAAGMIWRGATALDHASSGTAAVMIFLAAVTGLLLPILAYLGIALDGSKVSRERDALAAELDDDLGDYQEAIADNRRDLDGVGEICGTLKNKTFPDICQTTQEAVDAVYGAYGTVRLLIGGLSADPPARTAKTVNVDLAGRISGYIGTSIPGAGTVSLDPLFDRQRRLDEIEAQRSNLAEQIDALPPHPWGMSHHAWPHDDAMISGTQTAGN